jgi:serine/threonine protein kinase
VTDWHARWAADCESVRRQIAQRVRTNIMRDAVAELSDPLDQELALTLLVYEANHKSSCYTVGELALMHALTSRLSNFAQLDVPEVEDWFIPSHEVEITSDQIGYGGFGRVYRGTWLKTDVAVKCVRIKNLDGYHTFLREVRVWHCAQHRHIVRFYGACHVGSQCFVVCEYASNGSLVKFLDEQRKLGRKLAWRKLHQVALGLLFLHQKQIVHGDLKGDNILVAADGTAMLTDFGLSFSLQQVAPDPTRPQLDDRLGAMRWRAPEYAGELSTAPSFAADVYSLGMCIVEAVTGKSPWAKVEVDQAIKPHLYQGEALFKPSEMANDEWGLVRSMTTREPAQRLPLLDVKR